MSILRQSLTPILATVLIAGLVAAQKFETIKAEDVDSIFLKHPESAVCLFGHETTDDFRTKVVKETIGLMRPYVLTEPTDKAPTNGVLVLPAGDTKFREAHAKYWKASNYSLDQLIEFLDPLVRDTVEKVDGAIFQEWLQNKLQFGTKYVVVLLDNNPKKKHLGYRSLGLVPRFKEEFHLAWVSENADKVKDVMRVEKYPAVMTMYMVANKEGDPNDKSVAAMPYKGPSIGYGYLYGWLTQILKQAGKGKEDLDDPLRANANNEPEPEFSDEITVMSEHNAARILDECDKVQCVLGFENYWLEDSVRFEKTLAELKKVQKGFNRQGLKVIMVDAGCHQYLLTAVGLQFEFMPGLVLYSAKYLEYTPLMGKFESRDIIEFIRKAKAKVYKPYKLQSKLSIFPRNCEEEREKWEALKLKASVKSEEDDELMKEVMEEIKRKEQEKQFAKDSRKKKRRSDEL